MASADQLSERTIRRIRLDDIEVDEGPRPIDDEAVARLARSMSDIGLHTPITVGLERTDEKGRFIYCVAAGRHRIAAARSLGWEEIEALLFDDNIPEDADINALAEMWGIAENLHRLDLSKEQRDQQIKRYAELIEQRDQQLLDKMTDNSPHPVGRPESTATKVSKETGVSARTVRRALNPRPTPTPEMVAAQKRLRANNAFWRVLDLFAVGGNYKPDLAIPDDLTTEESDRALVQLNEAISTLHGIRARLTKTDPRPAAAIGVVDTDQDTASDFIKKSGTNSYAAASGRAG